MKFLVTAIVLLFLSSSLFAWPMIERKKAQEEAQANTIESNGRAEGEGAADMPLAVETTCLTSTTSPQENENEAAVSTTPQLPSQNEAVTAPVAKPREVRDISQEFIDKVKELNDAVFDSTEKENLLRHFVEEKLAQAEYASTMAFFRVFDFGDPSNNADGYAAWVGYNPAHSYLEKPFLLNDLNHPARICISQEEGVPNPIIKLDNEPKLILSGNGYLIGSQATINEIADKFPEPKENEAIRHIVYETFQAFFSDSNDTALKEAIEKIISSEEIEKDITPRHLGEIFNLISEPEKEKFINTLDQLKNSASVYAPLELSFKELRRLPSPERLAYYQSLTETRASLISKVFRNGTKGSFILSLPFLTGAAFGAVLNILRQTDFSCHICGFYYPGYGKIYDEYNMLAFHNDVHASNNSLSNYLYGYRFYVNHSLNHSISDYYHYLENYLFSFNYSSHIYPGPSFYDYADYHTLHYNNVTETYYANHPYMSNRSTSYYDNFINENFFCVNRCWRNPDHMLSDVADETMTNVFWNIATEWAFLLGGTALADCLYRSNHGTARRIGYEIFNFAQKNATRIFLGVLTNFIVSPFASVIAARYRTEVYDTDDIFGVPNAFRIESRSSDFGSTVGTGLGLGLFCAIGFGKPIIEHLQASKYFQYAGNAWNSWRFRSANIKTALDELRQFQTQNEEIKSQIENHFLPPTDHSLSSSPNFSNKIQDENEVNLNNIFKKILLGRVNERMKQCSELIQQLYPQESWFSSWKTNSGERANSAQGYEMVPLDDESEVNVSDHQEEDPLSQMEEGGKVSVPLTGP